MKKIGVFFGNFNPIHLGHTSFLKIARKEYCLDMIYMVAVENKKEEILNSIPIEEKRTLCELAIKNLDYIKLYPENLVEKKDILKILENLKEKYEEVYLVVGPYFLSELEKVYFLDEIIKIVKVLSLASSKKLSVLKNKYPTVEFKEAKLKPIQSRKIRISISNGKDCSEVLNSLVNKYIQKQKIFFGKESLFLECYDLCRQNMSKKRFSHCNFVSKAAQELAIIYKENEIDAKIAGILHDLMKEKTKEYMQNIFNTYNFKLNETQKINLKIWHGLAAALYIEHVLEINNHNIVRAVKFHTVPRKNMSTFEKIIFMADRTSEDRKYKDVDILRELVKKDLDGAVLYSLKNTVSSLLKKESTISTPTIECYNSLILKKMENKNGEKNANK